LRRMLLVLVEGREESVMALTATARRRGERAVLLAAALAASVAVASVAILLASGRSAEAAFPGKNGEIAFVSTRDGNSDIYVMNPDGTGQTSLIPGPDSNEQFPAFSPDGEQLAFSSDRDGNEEIYVTDLDGSADPVPLTETESPEPPEPPVVNTRVDWGPFLYDCVGRPLATLKTQLSGDKEEPGPGDPDGTGRAAIKVFKAQAFFALTVENIEPATAAHIHLGLRDEAGPVVAPLVPPPTGGSSSACVDIPRALSLELREHPFRYYVNVHNEEFPNGAVRGQLHR
jgi:CHRD domain/WD40-like Beta Propeller Repeat